MWKKKTFRSHSRSRDTKLHTHTRAFQTLLMPVLLYGAEKMGCVEPWPAKATDIPDEMPPQHPQCHPVRQIADCYHLGENRGASSGGPVVREGPAALWECLEDGSSLSPEAICVVQTEWKEETSSWCTSRWCDLTSDDLSGMTIWLEAFQDHTEWQANIHQLQPRTASCGQ